MEMRNIPIEEIHEDFFFCFTTCLNDSKLLQSIRIAGIYSPITVHRFEEKYRIISGFRRYHAAKSIGLEEIPVYEFESNELMDAFKRALTIHTVHRDFTIIEKAKILQILRKLCISEEIQLKKYYPLLDIPPQIKLSLKFESLLEMKKDTQDYIEKYNLSLKQSSMFDGLDGETQEEIIAIASQLEIRAVELGRLIDLIRDITGRDRVSIHQVLTDERIQHLLDDKEKTREQKITFLKSELNSRRYPKLTIWNQKLSNTKKQLGMPPFVSLDWNPSLESPGLALNATLRSVDNIKSLADKLSDSRVQELFKAMFEIV